MLNHIPGASRAIRRDRHMTSFFYDPRCFQQGLPPTSTRGTSDRLHLKTPQYFDQDATILAGADKGGNRVLAKIFPAIPVPDERSEREAIMPDGKNDRSFVVLRQIGTIFELDGAGEPNGSHDQINGKSSQLLMPCQGDRSDYLWRIITLGVGGHIKRSLQRAIVQLPPGGNKSKAACWS